MCGYLDFIEQQAVCQSNISALKAGQFRSFDELKNALHPV